VGAELLEMSADSPRPSAAATLRSTLRTERMPDHGRHRMAEHVAQRDLGQRVASDAEVCDDRLRAVEDLRRAPVAEVVAAEVARVGSSSDALYPRPRPPIDSPPP
jgi:hypothetical protein